MFREIIKNKKKNARIDQPVATAEITHACGRLHIRLPQGHTLPKYQNRHRDYDRFLPHLAGHVGGDATIVDVGANCGYVVAAMAQQNERAAYVCIEPDPLFNAYLKLNVDILKSAYPDVRVTILDYLVGKNVNNAILKNSGGTSVAVPGEGTLTARTLDDIMVGLSMPHVCLLKTDVDGFDYDVLDSARGLIADQKPAIYFECQHDDDHQKKGFEATIQWLSEHGYVRWALFDNYGAFIMTSQDIEPLYSLMNYVMRQNRGRSTRTMYYLDILCVCSADIDMMNAALGSY